MPRDLADIDRNVEHNPDTVKPMVLALLDDGDTIADILRRIHMTEAKFYRWRRRDPVWDEQIKKRTRERTDPKEAMIYDPDAPLPSKGSFVGWRQKYLGRPCWEHHKVMADLALDPTVRALFAFLPPGAGKDTTLNDLVGYVKCDDRNYLRVAWIMETEKFSMRRLSERLSPYFTNPHAYDVAPIETPGATKPQATLIEDFGPFKWEKGLKYPDGTRVPEATWNKHEMRFLASARAPEADPDIWATGVKGTLYGARVGLMIFSDIFTQENSREPTVVEDRVHWCKGTAKSRLDSRGKLWVIGTALENNLGYDSLLEHWVKESPVVDVREEGPITVVRHGNGTVVMTCRAIWRDENGEERSYWEPKFPLHDKWEAEDGTWYEIDEFSWEEAKERNLTRIDGLVTIRDADPSLFEATYQQNPTEDGTLFDFTDDVLDLCDDFDRSYGVVYPHERLVVSTDPARTGGAAWALLAVDVEAETITVADFREYSKLGLQGIKSKLVREPIVLWSPESYCYEVNHEEGVLYDFEIQRMFKDYGVEVVHHTTGHNRSDPEIGVASLGRDMRRHTIRFPCATPADRARTLQIKRAFKNWDSASAARRPTRVRRRAPDDLCMAIWIGITAKCRAILERRHRSHHAARKPVPEIVRRKWNQRKPVKPERTEPQGDYRESSLQALFIGDD